MEIPIVPLMPTGATLGSFATAIKLHNTFESASSTRSMLFGTLGGLGLDIFGQGVLKCSQIIRSGAFADRNHTLEHHTLWPFFAYALPAPFREQWRAAQLSSSVFPWRAYLHGLSLQGLIKANSCACLACVEDDFNRYGIAYWRTYHQLPGIEHCIKHLAPLISQCHACGTLIQAGRYSLPSMICASCGLQLVARRTAGCPAPYWKVLEIIRMLFDGSWQAITPDFSRPYYQRALCNIALFPLNDNNLQTILSAILRRWKMRSISDLFSFFKVSTTKTTATKKMWSALSGMNFDVNPFIYILLIEHFRSTQKQLPDLFSVREMQPEIEEYRFPFAPGPFSLPQDKQNEVLEALDASGIQRNVLYELATGVSWGIIRRRDSLSNFKVSKLYSQIPWFRLYFSLIGSEKWSRNLYASNMRSSRLKDSTYRKTAERCAALGSDGLENLYRNHRKAYNYLRKHDRDFLRRVGLSTRRERREVLTPETCMPRILKLINDPRKLSRTEIWRSDKPAMLYASKHCYAWLQEILPPSRRNGLAKKLGN
ncbi:hypothetical protein G3N95_25085 [Paraburkholderia sp. Tr-20389]|uniref:hypothetical protein n=1 Tax=Paraburkholderia sp. Tr-20389 TaxID=2703903 RepID=UPI0019824712|nr:hypothetical protein [Paraburkholderia sp. Tr-20389]MBN3756238.1 hypothetical protein [Paraburkholderia sp. Tr-20389]